MKPHKHAEVIKQWADGKKIEYRANSGAGWIMATSPSWDRSLEYRIKPEPPAKVYPETRMTEQQFVELIARGNAISVPLRLVRLARDAANAAIRHAIDEGQVVVPTASPSFTGQYTYPDSLRAARDMAIAEAMNDYWIRQMGNSHNFGFPHIPAILKSVDARAED